MGKRKLLLGAALALVLVTAAAILLQRSEFRGSRVKNPDAYLLDIQRMNGTDSHSLTLKRGDSLAVTLEITGGRLRVEITAPDGSEIYRGNGTETSEFTLGIPEDGLYTVSVHARHAKGTLRVRAVENDP